MLELFTLILKKYNFPESKVEQYVNEFSGIALLSLLAANEEKLSAVDKESLQQALKNKNHQEVWRIIRSAYTSDTDLENAIDEIVRPLLKEYIQDVVK